MGEIGKASWYSSVGCAVCMPSYAQYVSRIRGLGSAELSA